MLLAIQALPAHFSSSLDVSGVRATDLFSFNAPLGAAIEEQVVASLNSMRAVWDPAARYQIYNFVRQPQTFPDVRLQTEAPKHVEPVLMGIELKGWFALAKEGEPSFRYLVTPDACAAADLMVVVPWLYKNVISGTPTLLQPFIDEARYAAMGAPPRVLMSLRTASRIRRSRTSLRTRRETIAGATSVESRVPASWVIS